MQSGALCASTQAAGADSCLATAVCVVLKWMSQTYCLVLR